MAKRKPIPSVIVVDNKNIVYSFPSTNGFNYLTLYIRHNKAELSIGAVPRTLFAEQHEGELQIYFHQRCIEAVKRFRAVGFI